MKLRIFIGDIGFERSQEGMFCDYKLDLDDLVQTIISAPSSCRALFTCILTHGTPAQFEALIRKLPFDKLTAEQCRHIMQCIIDNATTAQFAEFVTKLNFSLLNDVQCDQIVDCIVESASPEKITELLRRFDFSDLTGAQCRAIFECILTHGTPAQFETLIRKLPFDKLTALQCQHIMQCIIDNSTTAQFAEFVTKLKLSLLNYLKSEECYLEALEPAPSSGLNAVSIDDNLEFDDIFGTIENTTGLDVLFAGLRFRAGDWPVGFNVSFRVESQTVVVNVPGGSNGDTFEFILTDPITIGPGQNVSVTLFSAGTGSQNNMVVADATALAIEQKERIFRTYSNGEEESIIEFSENGDIQFLDEIPAGLIPCGPLKNAQITAIQSLIKEYLDSDGSFYATKEQCEIDFFHTSRYLTADLYDFEGDARFADESLSGGGVFQSLTFGRDGEVGGKAVFYVETVEGEAYDYISRPFQEPGSPHNPLAELTINAYGVNGSLLGTSKVVIPNANTQSLFLSGTVADGDFIRYEIVNTTLQQNIEVMHVNVASQTVDGAKLVGTVQTVCKYDENGIETVVGRLKENALYTNPNGNSFRDCTAQQACQKFIDCLLEANTNQTSQIKDKLGIGASQTGSVSIICSE